MKKKELAPQIPGMMILLTFLIGLMCVTSIQAAAIGNPSVANGWNSAAALAVGNPSAANGWDTTSAVSIRAYSSQHYARTWTLTIDGSGLESATGLKHDNSPTNMGLSSAIDGNLARGGTVPGYIWVEYDLGAVYNLGEMWIWNYNELNWPHFGMNEVTIQYSTTGSTSSADWTTIYDNTIPLAAGAGLSNSVVDLAVDFMKASVRYVVITTDTPPFHNYKPQYDDAGLSEVRFNLPAAVKVTASSENPNNRKALYTINGSGIDPCSVGDGTLHSNKYYEMWTSGTLLESAAHHNGGTVQGSHWIRYDFDQSYELAQMWIWNYNELNWPTNGMKDVTIQYSNVAEPNEPYEWQTAFVGTIPMATGGGLYPSPVDLKVNFGGAAARHVVITAVSDINKNWTYNDPNGIYLETVGLSEVRFFTVPQNCAEAIADGYDSAADANLDCYVDLRDFALLSQDWLQCMDPVDTACLHPWE